MRWTVCSGGEAHGAILLSALLLAYTYESAGVTTELIPVFRPSFSSLRSLAPLIRLHFAQPQVQERTILILEAKKLRLIVPALDTGQMAAFGRGDGPGLVAMHRALQLNPPLVVPSLLQMAQLQTQRSDLEQFDISIALSLAPIFVMGQLYSIRYPNSMNLGSIRPQCFNPSIHHQIQGACTSPWPAIPPSGCEQLSTELWRISTRLVFSHTSYPSQGATLSLGSEPPFRSPSPTTR